MTLSESELEFIRDSQICETETTLPQTPDKFNNYLMVGTGVIVAVATGAIAVAIGAAPAATMFVYAAAEIATNYEGCARCDLAHLVGIEDYCGHCH